MSDFLNIAFNKTGLPEIPDGGSSTLSSVMGDLDEICKHKGVTKLSTFERESPSRPNKDCGDAVAVIDAIIKVLKSDKQIAAVYEPLWNDAPKPAARDSWIAELRAVRKILKAGEKAEAKFVFWTC